MSTLIETQAQFRQLADERLDEAVTLLAAGKWGGAYYLAGYAVELAVKACVIKRLMATDAFPKKDFSRDCYTHTLERLMELAAIHAAFAAARDADGAQKANCALAKDWSEEKRYHLIAEAEARDFFHAVADAAHGVLSWVKTCW